MTVVELEPDALDRLGSLVATHAPNHRIVLISDDHVAPLYADRAAASFQRSIDILTVPAGEVHKTRETWARLTDAMLERACGRDTTIVALGGGVVGDLAGFVAATYMRGIPVVQVPTTLLAMIDAALGGKTGVDTPAGKNLVGAFHPPPLVVIDPRVLRTLPVPELRAGLAEAIKHGVIADAAYFARTLTDLPILMTSGEPADEAMQALIEGSIRIKTTVVASDARERGRRKILNFGHTIGHAVEAATDYAVRHGEAVAIGMMVEARLAELAGVAACGVTEQIGAAIDAAGLPSTPPTDIHPSDLVARTHSDKKTRGGAVEYALPRSVGMMAGEETGWGIPLADEFVLSALSR